MPQPPARLWSPRSTKQAEKQPVAEPGPGAPALCLAPRQAPGLGSAWFFLPFCHAGRANHPGAALEVFLLPGRVALLPNQGLGWASRAGRSTLVIFVAKMPRISEGAAAAGLVLQLNTQPGSSRSAVADTGLQAEPSSDDLEVSLHEGGWQGATHGAQPPQRRGARPRRSRWRRAGSRQPGSHRPAEPAQTHLQ